MAGARADAAAAASAATERRDRQTSKVGLSLMSAVRSLPKKSTGRGGALAEGGLGLIPVGHHAAKQNPPVSVPTINAPSVYPLVRSSSVCSERPSEVDEKSTLQSELQGTWRSPPLRSAPPLPVRISRACEMIQIHSSHIIGGISATGSPATLMNGLSADIDAACAQRPCAQGALCVCSAKTRRASSVGIRRSA